MDDVTTLKESTAREEDQVSREIQAAAELMQKATTKGELGTIVSREVQKYSLFDLQIIGGRLNSEIEKLPSPYREAISPFFREQLFGKHHQQPLQHPGQPFCRHPHLNRCGFG